MAMGQTQGSGPQSAKEFRKQGKPNLNMFIKAKDAAGYKSMVTKVATRIATNGAWPRVRSA